jgi:transcription elongation factor
LIKVAIPVTCGQAIEVPERMLNCAFPTAGDQAARMFNPGAVISGYKGEQSESLKNIKRQKKGMEQMMRSSNSFRIIDLFERLLPSRFQGSMHWDLLKKILQHEVQVETPIQSLQQKS